MEQQPHNPVPIELENQFLIRLPPEPAEALREAVKSGASNLKDRLFIQMEPDKPNHPNLRRGTVKFDGWTMSTKLVDLPAILESHKTIDRKNLYKTADICQMLICKEGEPSEDEFPEEEDKKKDPAKVEKKFIYPHGITPPLKNCRKRRFRKTLKKKHCLDEPEIEKEVKRLFRDDHEAVSFKYQLLTEEELNAGKAGGAAGGRTDTNLGEQDLFGSLSDVEDDGPDHDRSDSKIEPASESDSTAAYGELDSSHHGLVTQFSKDMFKPPMADLSKLPSSSAASLMSARSIGEDAVAVKLAKVKSEIVQLRQRKQEIERNIATCPNSVLQQRLRETLLNVETELRNREMEADAFSLFS